MQDVQAKEMDAGSVRGRPGYTFPLVVLPTDQALCHLLSMPSIQC